MGCYNRRRQLLGLGELVETVWIGEMIYCLFLVLNQCLKKVEVLIVCFLGILEILWIGDLCMELLFIFVGFSFQISTMVVILSREMLFCFVWRILVFVRVELLVHVECVGLLLTKGNFGDHFCSILLLLLIQKFSMVCSNCSFFFQWQ